MAFGHLAGRLNTLVTFASAAKNTGPIIITRATIGGRTMLLLIVYVIFEGVALFRNAVSLVIGSLRRSSDIANGEPALVHCRPS